MNLAKKLLKLVREEENDEGVFVTGPFEFAAEEQDGPRVLGTLKYQGTDHHGYIGYDDDQGIEWDFDPEIEPEGDEDMDHWIDLVMEVVGDYQLAYAAEGDAGVAGDGTQQAAESRRAVIREAARKIWNR